MFSGFLDEFYDIIFKPQAGLKKVNETRGFWHGLIIYLLVLIITSLSTIPSALPEQISQELQATGLNVPFGAIESLARMLPLLNIFIIICFAPFFFILQVGVYNLIAEVLGGKSQGSNLAALWGYTRLPAILVAPFSVLFRFLNFELISIVTLITGIWILVIRIMAIKELYRFSTGRSILLYFLPYILLLSALIVFLLFFGAFLIPFFAEFLPV